MTFAFAGHTKSGKSSLINAIRGVKDDNEEAAKVGICETTHVSTKYFYNELILQTKSFK